MTAEDHFKKGKAYYESNPPDYTKAVSEFTAAINALNDNSNSNSTKASYYWWRASAYDKQKGKEALEDFLTASDTYIVAAKAETDKANKATLYGNAEKTVNEALRIDKENGKVWNAYGNVKWWQGDYEEAGKKYEEGIIKKNFDQSILNTSLAASKYEQSKKEENPQERQNLLTDALKNLDTAQNSTTKDSRIPEYRAKVNYALGNYKEALKYFESLDEKKQKYYEKEIKDCIPHITPNPYWQAFLKMFENMDDLLRAFIIILAINLVLVIAYKIKSRTLTFGIAVQEILLVAIFLVIIFALNEIDKKELIAMSLRDTILIICLVYALLSILENAGHLGVPIPSWLTNLLQDIIEMIKRFFRRP